MSESESEMSSSERGLRARADADAKGGVDIEGGARIVDVDVSSSSLRRVRLTSSIILPTQN